jgi:hypothetical protein
VTTTWTKHLPLLSEETFPGLPLTDVVPTSLVCEVLAIWTREEMILIWFSLHGSTSMNLKMCQVIPRIIEKIFATDKTGFSIKLVHFIRGYSQSSQPQ